MTKPRLFLCSGATLAEKDPQREGRHIVELDSLGSDPNINIKLQDVAKNFSRHITPRLIDFLEIAAYVYSADCATSRGSAWTNDSATESWARDFHFVIPVRDPDFWQSDDTQKFFKRILLLLSDDKYDFSFVKLNDVRPVQQYLDFGEEEQWPFQDIERVLMFSGGLDSLTGAVETAANGHKLVLISHRTVPTLSSRQKNLYEKLREVSSVDTLHIPVWINKDSGLTRESTQRTRSFLYCALGTVVAGTLNAKGVRFFENGIVSLNLPVADEVLRARASRTTHPQVLSLFSELCSLIVERDFIVDNPFLFKTKTEVIKLLSQRGGRHLIPYTCSCAHTAFKSKNQWHCGTCSQCIDRRISMLAAGEEKYDPETDYVSDVFTGSRGDGYEKNMAVDYVRHAVELASMSDEEMSKKFNRDLSRAIRPMPNSMDAAQKFIDMHRRHGESVSKVLEEQLKQHSIDFVKCRLPDSSMLALVAGQRHTESHWKRYAGRITELLTSGIPIACKTHKPKNEPHLQEICDGILQSNDHKLIREFPFMRWSSNKTKPDWSYEGISLWVELKYIRKQTDVRVITEDIAADITKYGDNERRILFVVYDPNHLITDEAEFCEQMILRTNIQVRFIR